MIKRETKEEEAGKVSECVCVCMCERERQTDRSRRLKKKKDDPIFRILTSNTILNYYYEIHL